MKKSTPKKYRNPAAIPAKIRSSSGPMRNKKDKRQDGNKQRKYIDENY